MMDKPVASDSALERIPSESLVDVAASRLRAAILAGELRPDQPVHVRALVSKLGISHIPIREALRQLEGEGLVTSQARHAHVVPSLKLEDFSAVLELRSMVEIPTARKAVERVTSAELVELRETYRELEQAAEDTRAERFWQIHRKFHWLLVAPGANKLTRRVLEPLWQENERYVRLYVTTAESADATLKLHLDLVEALEARDADLLATRLQHHFSVRGRWVVPGPG